MSYNGTDEFSSDSDLAEFEKALTDLLGSGETAFSIFHTAARVKILDVLVRRHREYFWDYKTADAYDYTIIVDKTQLKRASCFFVLGEIFNREVLSGNASELYMSKRVYYMGQFNSEIFGLQLDIDTNNDGVADNILVFGGIRLERV